MINAAVNLIWSPVRDLDIGLEVSYDRIELGGGGLRPEQVRGPRGHPGGRPRPGGGGLPVHDEERGRVARSSAHPTRLLIGQPIG